MLKKKSAPGRGTAKEAEPIKKRKVALSQAKSRPPIPEAKTAVREWPKLEVFTEGQLSKARKTVANQYGKAFASKASDHLCQAL